MHASAREATDLLTAVQQRAFRLLQTPCPQEVARWVHHFGMRPDFQLEEALALSGVDGVTPG